MDEAIPSKLPAKIKLDVGGTIFVTTIGTLTSIKDSFFYNLFSGRWDIHLDEDGTIFIDRSPSLFQHVLDFLRNPIDEFDTEGLTQVEINSLLKEARYYQIEPLVRALEASKVPKNIFDGSFLPIRYRNYLQSMVPEGPSWQLSYAAKDEQVDLKRIAQNAHENMEVLLLMQLKDGPEYALYTITNVELPCNSLDDCPCAFFNLKDCSISDSRDCFHSPRGFLCIGFTQKDKHTWCPRITLTNWISEMEIWTRNSDAKHHRQLQQLRIRSGANKV